MSTQIQSVAENMKSPLRQTLDNAHVSGLPRYRPRPLIYSEKTDSVNVTLPGLLCERLSTLTRDEPLLQYAAVMASVHVCLYRYAGSYTNAVGSPMMVSENGMSNRDSVVSVIVAVDDEMTFRQLLINVRQTILDSYAQESYPLSRLFELGQNGASTNRCPLFDVALEIPGLHNTMPEARHDVTLTFDPKSRPLSLRAAFSPELYDRQTVLRFCLHILGILNSGLQQTNMPISELELLADEEREHLSTWNATAVEYPKNTLVHELFEGHAVQSPSRTALVFGNMRLTYQELNERANQVAHYLRRLHIIPDTPIGIFLNRSIEQVISVLGILKAGGAYVPFDPTYPRDRLSAMSEDLKVKVILTNKGLLERLPPVHGRIVCLDGAAETIAAESRTNPTPSAGPSNLCYVIFTSGSTGRPKASAVYHRGWTNLLHWFVSEFRVAPTDKTLVISSISFDITQRAMAMPLISGGELHLLPSDYYDPPLILHKIETEEISLLNCAPSTFYPLVECTSAPDYQKLRSLRCVFLGGEAISASRLKLWAASEDCKAEIVNVYGVAECSDVSTFYRLHDFDQYVESSVPIGKPNYNNQAYVLDKKLRPVPIGVTGEIWLGGAGVGKGYITDPFLTAQRFRENPFAKAPGEYFYRTGDLGRYLPDGNLEFNGRVDHQVKVRGQRVELGEIETVLRQQPKVKEAVVVEALYTPGDQRLIAYLVPTHDEYLEGSKGLIDELRRALAKKLPQYMIPNQFVLIKEMPLSPNAKIDRGALARADVVSVSDGSDVDLTATEQSVAELYSKLLGTTKITSRSNFFDLGGHSLLVTQMVGQISETFQIQFEPADLYRDPTVAGIASQIDVASTKKQVSVS